MSGNHPRSFGRGGAGNYVSSDVRPQRRKDDLEAGLTEHNNSQHNVSPQNISQANTSKGGSEYVHTGRGGAGNWVHPTSSSSAGPNDDVTAEAGKDPILPSVKEDMLEEGQIGKMKGMTGRGGAGNYYLDQYESAKNDEAKKQQIYERQQELHDSVKKDVEAQMSVPEQAFVDDQSAH